MCQDHRFCLIQGCAGSGKTTLALHKAKLLAESGKNVLLVCFNQPLGEYLRKQCEGYDRITVGPFLEMCLDWLQEAGNPLTRREDGEFWESVLPDLFTSKIDSIPHRFDAIVVDEGQDFKENHWIMLEMLFADPESANFYIFNDGRQNIYHGSGKYPVQTMPILLWQNVRNTNQIFAAVKRVCELPDDIEPSGVDGPAVRMIAYSDADDMRHQIDLILMDLVRKNFRSQDIVLLGTKSQRRTTLTHGSKIGQFRLVADRKEVADLLTMTVHRYKGLESPVVILCELDDDLKDNLKEILYIGMTRPMGMLYVLHSSETKKALQGLPF
jgi:superfamily I DNA/RNA helicase